MMDLGLSDAEERQVFGWDEEICELCGGFGECADGDCDEFDENDWADDQIKAGKEEPEYYRSIL